MDGVSPPPRAARDPLMEPERISRFAHWTPRYVRDRLLVWLNEKLHPDWPWLTRDAVTLLHSLLRPDHAGLEFGSGRSTIWFGKRVGRLVSVESDEGWFQRVAQQLRNENFGHVTLLHKSGDDYVAVANQQPDESLDFALVDGIMRDLCARAVLPKLRPGGLLIIDNINWFVPSESVSPTSRRGDDYASPLWRELFTGPLAAWRRIWTSNGVTDTLIAFKPSP